MNVTEFDRKVRTYLPTLPREEAQYAARYAHFLIYDPEQALALAEATKLGIRAARRKKIRQEVLAFNLDGRL